MPVSAPGDPKRLSIPARFGLLALLLVVATAAGLVGFWLIPDFGPAPRGPASASAPATTQPLSVEFLRVVVTFFAVAGIVLGVVFYGIAVATRFFITDLSRPFVPAFKTRVWLAQTIVPMPAMLGLGLLLSLVVTPRLQAAGLEFMLAYMIPVLAVVILSQVVLVWFQLWTPVERALIRGRLRAMGIGQEDLARGRLIGISDPDVSSFKKLGIVEDDLGMLWITAGSLRYIGDLTHFDIPRERVVRIEQKADAGNTVAIAGASHVIVTYVDAERIPRRVRLHVEGVGTIRGKARGLDELAAELRRWHGGE
jgi:hypothetical protein